MKKSVRMADIAQQLGISTVSVSKALAGKPGVSKETRTKVIALARQMGYSGTRVRYEAGLTGNISVLVSDHLFSENTFYTNLYRELVLRSGEDGFSCIVEIVSQEAEQTAVPPPLVAQQRIDGVIFMGPLDPIYLEAITAVGLPCLALDFRIPGLRIDSVRRDNAEGGFLLTKHLLSAGYEQIGFIGDIDHSSGVMERYWGYQWALRQSGIVPCDEWLWKDMREKEAVFTSDKLPEAFVCSNDWTAFHLADFLQHFSRPDVAEVALAYFDDLRILMRSRSQLAAYRVEPKRMAETAIQHLVRKIRREIPFPSDCIISGQLVTAKEFWSGDQLCTT